MISSLAYELAVSEENLRCDTQCKKILSIKSILAWILKYSVSEFSDLPVSEILACIEDIPALSSIGVLPGSSNEKVPVSVPDTITGLSNESKILHEGFITYDIRFSVSCPSPNGRVRLLINLEAQNLFHPGYDLVTRGFFYGTRMISAQLGTEFTIPHYDDIKKVYSIWICLNAPTYIGNAISQYQVSKKDIVPGIPDTPCAYDKLTVVLITLAENQPTDHKLLQLLKILFSNQIPYLQKLRLLEQDYSIFLSLGERKELEHMCNYSAYVWETGLQKGIKEGIEKGLQEGVKKGIDLGKQTLLKNLLMADLLPEELLAKAADYSLEEVLALKKELNL